MVCKETKTLYGRCGHIVTTIVHLRPCPLALAYQHENNNNNNNPQAQGQEGCGGNERYYRIIANAACVWCFMQDWSVTNFEQRVGGPEFLSQQVIENRRTVFETQIAAQAQLTIDENVEFQNAVTQDFLQTQRAAVIMHNQNRMNQVLDGALERVRRERIINSVLRPVEGELRDSQCSICGEDYGAGEIYEEGTHDPVLCRCGSNVPHEFGRSCILAWLQTSLTCPACRRELHEQSDNEEPAGESEHPDREG